jgi:hypothetical protein
MLVVIASIYDRNARALIDRWSAQEAHLLTCKDLSVVGWHHHLGVADVSTAVLGGQVIPIGRITGVLTRLPCVDAGELTHITPADRHYVAAEMTAFLASWLSGLTCPVLNRPTPACLMGPSWRREQWVHAAVQLGIPVVPVHRRAALTDGLPAEALEPHAITITVIGDRCFGEADRALMAQAQRLATAAGVGLLAAHFSGPQGGASLLGADLWPDISCAAIADAILEYLREGPRC